jgi:hypothetical protein
VKKGDYDSARKRLEILMLAAPPGSIVPEANLLQGQLLLKLGKYDDSQETYRRVIGEYGPVRDQIDRLLAVNGDPAAYFDKLLSQRGGSFDVASLLPPAARGFAASQREVREAQAVAQDLGDGQRGIKESDQIVQFIQKRMLNAASLDAFPLLQSGNESAGKVDSALIEDERRLVALERDALGSVLSSGEQAELQQLAAQGADLTVRFENLPKTDAQVKARDDQRLTILKERQKMLSNLQLAVKGLRATALAVQQLAEQTRAQRSADPADEKRLADELTGSIAAEVDGYETQISSMLRELRDAEVVDTATGLRGDEALRASYAAALQREADILAGAQSRASAPDAAMAQQIQAARDQVAGLRARCDGVVQHIRQAAIEQAAIIQEKLKIETQNLDDYRQEASSQEGNASGLVGRIAYQSFKRVRRQVYDLVLKADVGIIDVSWTKKGDDAEKIQKLASDKDRETRTLDDDFHEVLEEVH